MAKSKRKKPNRTRSTNAQPQLKRGPLSNPELDFILAHRHDMSSEEIALSLNRTAGFVRKVLTEHATGVKTVEDKERQEGDFKILMDLRMSPDYEEIKRQFTDTETRFIEHNYLSLYKQFQGDVMATETIQILQAVRLQVLMNRNLEERQNARKDIATLTKQLQDLTSQIRAQGGAPTDAQQDQMLGLQDEITTFRSAEHSCTKEYTDLQTQYNKLMETLKATRNQRLDKANSNQTNYVEVLKQLQARDVKESEGRTLELSKLAAKKEGLRLGRPTTFEDGHMDNPILNKDTVKLEPLPEERKSNETGISEHDPIGRPNVEQEHSEDDS